MGMSTRLADRDKDFAQWYQDVIYEAELVDESPVRGCYVIRPYAWAMWEHMRDYLNDRIIQTGHKNAAFPLLIPESFFKREAEHVEGFSPELAVVTHAGGKELEEPLVVRPTSETMIHHSFARWITSWRDLPLKINQWANVVRWEKRPRPFLRTTEFFWQEGHTAHETFQEAEEEVLLMLNEYVSFIQGQLSIPVIIGQKTDAEKFAGAEKTLTVESIMPDGKALQACTSHLLSQNFAKAFNIIFQDRDKNQAYPYLTSWGITTRMIGALIMTHGDQKGLVIPPAVAPIQIIIIPIYRNEAEREAVEAQYDFIKTALSGLRIEFDVDASKTPGAKFYYWELRGVPIRLEVGKRDADAKQVVLVNRVTSEKTVIPFEQVTAVVHKMLDDIQNLLYVQARERMESRIFAGEKLVEFGPTMEKDGGAFITGWCGSAVCEQELKKYKAFTRCILDTNKLSTCFHCNQSSNRDVLVAKAY
jgi:prolyl-tRNA synthetase